MLLTGNYLNLYYQIFVQIVYNIAYTLALYGLLLFYLACREDIRAYSPVRKFFAVKIVIFATYWQGLAVSYTPGVPIETAALWNDFILCLEMSVFALIHLYSFPWYVVIYILALNIFFINKNISYHIISYHIISYKIKGGNLKLECHQIKN